MNNAIISAEGFDIHVRTEREGDDNVIGEVLRSDTYRLKELKDSGYEVRTFLSVGSHIGTAEMLVHRYWPDAKCISVEPNKRSFELLKLNAPFSSAYNAAVFYGNPKHLILTDGEGATGGGFTVTKEYWDEQEKQNPGKIGYCVFDDNVRALTLEELFKLEGIESVDLAKFDCESGEIGAFQNMLPATAQKIKRVVGEYHTENGFEWFKALAEKTFPHLEIYGGNAASIGPFFSKPK